MALSDLMKLELTAQEQSAIAAHLKGIFDILRPKAVNLTPEQRQVYGSVAEQNKLFINKVRYYMKQRPDLIPNVVDMTEFERDYQARTDIEPISKNVQILEEMMTDTKTLLDYDNYQDALSFYRYIRFLSQENEPGITTIFEDLKQFFIFKSPPTPPTEEDDNGASK